MKEKIYLQGKVEAIIKTRDWKIKSRTETHNTVVKTWQDHVADLLSRSFLLWQAHETTAPHFVDYMSIGAWMKLIQNSVNANEVYLPRDPKDGNEPNDYYNGCVVHCVSWANQGDSRAVAAGWYNNWTRRIELATPFDNVPLIGEVYTISTSTDDVMLQWEWEEDTNGNSISNPKKPITMKIIKTAPNINEVEIRAEWDEAEGAFIAGEAWLRYDLSAALPGQSSTWTVQWVLFAKGIFQWSVPSKTANNILEIRWTLRIGSER